MAPALTVSDLSVSYGKASVFTGISLTVESGEAVALMGPSGSGKSSLLACVTGMIVPQHGTVHVGGQSVSTMSAAARATYRRRQLGLIFQNADLLPELTIQENVALTLLFDGMGRAEALKRADEVLELVGLDEHRLKRTDQVSGGQAQRAALARALARRGIALMVADEPTASLDADNAAHVTNLLVSRSRDMGAGIILATHDATVAAKCDRVHDLRPASVATPA